MYLRGLLKLSVLLILVSACKKTDHDFKEIFLYADYRNINNNPQLQINNVKSSATIGIEAAPTVRIPGDGRLYLDFNNIRFEDEFGVYQLKEPLRDQIITEKQNENGVYENDFEDSLRASKSLSLDYVLVIDASTSLGSDYTAVQQYALEFINQINNSGVVNANFGLVVFSGTISSLPIGTTDQAADNLMKSVQRDNATKLYEAINAGLDLFNGSIADGKAIIVFTDGKNNAQSDPKFETVNYVEQRISLINDLSSYTIGFEGKQSVDTEILTDLAINKGFFSAPKTVDDVKNDFKTVASSVSAVYVFTYDTNDSPVTIARQLKFRIKVERIWAR